MHSFYFGRTLVCIALAIGSDQIITAKSSESIEKSANPNENCCIESCVKLCGPLALQCRNSLLLYSLCWVSLRPREPV